MPKIDISKVQLRTGSGYPAEFQPVTTGREKLPLGNAVGLTQFGVNLTRLKPGAASALRHWHENEDEFIYVLEGELVLVENEGETILRPGDAAGFKAGIRDAHHLINRSDRDVVYLEIGDRNEGDEVFYPDDDLHLPADASYTHKDGTPWIR